MQNPNSTDPSTSMTHPLELSVHEMPEQSLQDPSNPSQSRRGRWTMWLILLVCAAPVIASYYSFYVIKPHGKSTHGELIVPSIDMPEAQVKDLAGQTHALRELKGQWLFMSVGSGKCDEACQARLYAQRQLIVSLGAEQDRVDWVWLIDDEQALDARLLPALATAKVFRVAPSVLQAWLSPLPGKLLADDFYLVDPQGQWMERFEALGDAKHLAGIKKDLTRLLTASASWDQAGRP